MTLIARGSFKFLVFLSTFVHINDKRVSKIFLLFREKQITFAILFVYFSCGRVDWFERIVL